MSLDLQNRQFRRFIWDIAARQRRLEASAARLEQRYILLEEREAEVERLRCEYAEALRQPYQELIQPVLAERQRVVDEMDELWRELQDLKAEHQHLKNLSRPKLLATKAALEDEVQQLTHERDKRRYEVKKAEAALRCIEVDRNILVSERAPNGPPQE